ncbi:MAG: hypothetical protein R2762_09560 [Bryobacteraceae bacterium]
MGNSQCSINATGSSVTGSGNTVSLTLNMSFTAGFGGRRIHYLAARDTVEHNSGWHAKGVWTVPFTQPATAVINMSPARAEGNVVTLTTVFSDVNGFADLNVLNILINDGIDGRNACYIAYVRPTRTLLLVNDAGAAGGPFAGTIAIPGTGIANNSQCAINATGSGIVESGNTVTLTLNLTLTGAFQGTGSSLPLRAMWRRIIRVGRRWRRSPFLKLRLRSSRRFLEFSNSQPAGAAAVRQELAGG